MKKCNGCKRTLDELNFTRKNKVHARCNDCSSNASCRRNICETCGIVAIFNIEGENWGRFCKIHKEINMVNVRSKTCAYSGCKKQPTYNYEGETRVKFCYIHKEDNMVNVRDKTCEYENCKKIPSFNNEGETKGKFCSIHKEDTMINVRDKTCEYSGCTTQPTYNYKGKSKRRFCSVHKEDGMIDIAHIKCEYENCKTIPTYNKEGETKALFCFKHKDENMINIRDKPCIYPGCKILPSFNKEGEHKALFCGEHKDNNMVSVKNRICIKTKCKTNASFGYCSQLPSYCSQHKLDYMIKKPKRTCLGNDEEDCKDMAIYGKDEPLHCEDHKLEGEICWLIKKCDNCGRNKEILNKDELCGICADIPFYEESKRLNKVKETIMVKYLRNNIKEYEEILADRIIDSTCNLYRPDILYDCGTHIVVVECDENQHKNYNWESCSLNKCLEHMEEKRMYEIMVAYGLPAIFLRWNPDNFNINGRINKKYNNNIRLEMLVKWVRYCMKMKVEPGVIYKKLFYDGYEDGDMSFKKIEETDLI